MANILMVGRGGYGDMFPLFAIAQRLKVHGHHVLIAAEAHHQDSVRSLGLELVATDKVRVGGAVGIRAKLEEISDTFSPRMLKQEYQVVLEAAADADLIIGNQVAYAGAMVRKKLQKRWVFCAPSPLAIPSYNDPPIFPYLQGVQTLTRKLGIPQKGFIDVARLFSRVAMLRNIQFERQLGIWNGNNPRFEGLYSDELNLILSSPALVSCQPDWPESTVVTGFAWFEPDFLRNEENISRFNDFMAAGAPPVIIAPGGPARVSPGEFFNESIAACKRLGRRCVVLAARRFHDRLAGSRDVLVSAYMPYSELLKGACALIHSGGIGAFGWALKFGVPSLMIPSKWDQFDTARLARRQGATLELNRRDLNSHKIAAALETLLASESIKSSTEHLRKIIVNEDGAGLACQRIESLLGPQLY